MSKITITSKITNSIFSDLYINSETGIVYLKMQYENENGFEYYLPLVDKIDFTKPYIFTDKNILKVKLQPFSGSVTISQD